MSGSGLEKMYNFSREDSYISHYFLCISLLKNTKFPTKWSHFPGRIFLISTFFPPWSGLRKSTFLDQIWNFPSCVISSYPQLLPIYHRI